MTPKKQSTFDIVSHLRSTREDLEYRVDAFLRERGWKSTSSTPGAYWLWEREVKGRTILVEKEMALNIEEYLELNKTQAELISVQFGDDGLCFTNNVGTPLALICNELAADRSESGDAIRWTFPDGSVITAVGGGWDFGYDDCFCYRGAGHNDDCSAEKE